MFSRVSSIVNCDKTVIRRLGSHISIVRQMTAMKTQLAGWTGHDNKEAFSRTTHAVGFKVQHGSMTLQLMCSYPMVYVLLECL